MAKHLPDNNSCCPQESTPCACPSSQAIGIQASMPDPVQDEVCCGAPPGPASSRFERPGYLLCRFVAEFIDTPIGPVPRLKTRLNHRDHLGTLAVRWAIKRRDYKVAPGLYCTGTPNPDSPVLVTANYKLTLDSLRKELAEIDAWVLVLDTRGINVWCAAGKALFSTREVVDRVRQTDLDKVVNHRELTLPQLSATGVCARQVRKDSGFKVIWGPIRVRDIKKFLANDFRAEAAMRRVTFSFRERLTLVPVELTQVVKPTLWVLLGIFLASGIGSNLFSLAAAWERSLMATAAYAAGILSGAILAPALLPWIPARPFALKGAITGIVCGIGIVLIFHSTLNFWGGLALLLCSTAISSFLAMNFTGSTPYTSPSGVEKEMRKAIPLQALTTLVAVAAWIGSGFAK
jgi:hypothetical protein